MARFGLADFKWELIRPRLPTKPRGVARDDNRRVLNGISREPRTVSTWRDLPERHGACTTVCNRFDRWAKVWAKAGIRVRVFEALVEKSPESLPFIDRAIIRAHQHAASGEKGVG